MEIFVCPIPTALDSAAGTTRSSLAPFRGGAVVGILLRARAAAWNDLAIAVFAGRHAFVGGETEGRETAAGLDRAGHGNRRHESAREPRDQERQVNEKVMWRTHGVLL